jgi:predicted DNA-binding protein (UPF0251 family)
LCQPSSAATGQPPFVIISPFNSHTSGDLFQVTPDFTRFLQALFFFAMRLMARPTQFRLIFTVPEVACFQPVGGPDRVTRVVSLSLEEIEAVRLKDLQGLEQEECAAPMAISRPTFQRVLAPTGLRPPISRSIPTQVGIQKVRDICILIPMPLANGIIKNEIDALGTQKKINHTYERQSINAI